MTMTSLAQANHRRGLVLPLLLAASLAVLTGPVLAARDGGHIGNAGAVSDLAARPKAAAPVDAPPLWGLGVKGCDAFLTTAKGWDQGVDADIAEYSRYQDWISGFVSGLNLATGDDVLRGAGIDGAMRQVRAYCTSQREADFFNATMGFVRSLSSLR